VEKKGKRIPQAVSLALIALLGLLEGKPPQPCCSVATPCRSAEGEGIVNSSSIARQCKLEGEKLEQL